MPDIIPNVVVSMPSQLFTMPRKFGAVFNSKIYIGLIDTDPTIPSNQIQVFLENEDGSRVPAAQPLIINAGGYPVYNGQIAKFVTVQGHSMAVYDRLNVQQFYFPNVLKYDPDQFSERLSNSDDGNGDALVAVKQPFTGSLARTQHDKNTEFLSILDFGAKGDGVTDDIAAWNACSSVRQGEWAFIKFNTGKTYYFNQIIRVYPKTVILIEEGAVIKLSGSTQARFFNGDVGNSTYAYGYDGDGDIHFTGKGVIDCNSGNGAAGFAHGKDISFTGITFQNASNTYFIEINSSRNVTISGCTFQDMGNTDGGLYEMLQFDYANEVGFPSFGAYDNTPCENVLVENCVFRDGSQGIGTHASPAVEAHKGIRIINNGLFNLTLNGIRAQGWAYGSVVSNNYLFECGDRPLSCLGTCSEMEFSNNFVNGGGSDTAGGFWFSVSGGTYPTRLRIVGNRAYKCKGEGFFLGGMTFSNIHDNEVYQCGRRGFNLNNGASSNKVFNNKVFAAGLLAANVYDAYYISNQTCNRMRFITMSQDYTVSACLTIAMPVLFRQEGWLTQTE